MTEPATATSSSPLTLPKAYSAASLFAPEKLVREARRQLGLPSDPIPAVVLLDPDGDVLRHLQKAGGARRVPHWACYHSQMWTATIGGTPVGIVPNVVGGPYAVLVAEQAFASGSALLIALTSAGRVTALPTPPPYFVVLDRAWRDEGTSLHYLPPSSWAEADPALLAALAGLAGSADRQPVLRGSSWTTDAPYRETSHALAAAAAAGASVVEMEAAALYAFGRARHRNVLCVAHVSNDVTSSDAADFEKGQQSGATAALQLLAGILHALHRSGHISAAAHPPAVVGPDNQAAAGRDPEISSGR